MLIVITSEQEIKEEAILVNQLFEEGLDILHLRKPDKDYLQHCEYLNQIDKKYHNRIVVHYFHELINDFNLKGIHFQEAKRQSLFSNEHKVLNTEFLKNYAKKLNTDYSILNTKTLSSSFHEPEVLANCDIDFDYHLLSPVFSSISKVGYEGRGFDVNSIDKTIIGMGGVNAETIPKVLKLGYKGIGVLGGVWNTENPIESFKAIKKVYETNN